MYLVSTIRRRFFDIYFSVCDYASSSSPKAAPSLTRTLKGPYLALGARFKQQASDGTSIGDNLVFDPTKEKTVTIPDLIVPKHLMGASVVGISSRWGICATDDEEGSSLVMSEYLNPSKMVTLPRFSTLPGNQTQLASDVAMSCDSPEEEDCVVAIKFLGKLISLEIPFSCLDSSNLVYSKKDHCFNFLYPGSNYLCSLDLNFKEGDSFKSSKLQFRDLPEFSVSEYQMLDLCSRSEHWVESSSGESFLIQWYTYVSPLEQREPRFMVFSEMETTEGKIMCYTEDIGDLCIFLSKSQPFCVEASSYPGLEPNSIYVVTLENFGVYNLATKTIREFEPPRDGPIEISFPPLWLPPSCY